MARDVHFGGGQIVCGTTIIRIIVVRRGGRMGV